MDLAPQVSSVERAKDLLGLLPFIWAIVTVTLLAPAWKWSSEEEKFHLGRSLAAVGLAAVAFVIGVITTIALTPLALEILFRNKGPMQGVLVLYGIFFAAVVGATVWALVVIVKAVLHLLLVLRD